MKHIDINRLSADKVIKGLKDVESYINSLLSVNDSLRDKLDNFNKDEEIQKLQEEINNIRSQSLLIMSENEKKDSKEFSQEHYKSCKSNVIYILEGTGIGTSITLKCKKCNTEKNVTDVSSW